MFYTDRKPTILDRVNLHKRCLLHRYERRHAFYSVCEQDLNRLGFGETAIEHSHFRNNETKDKVVYTYQSNLVGIEPFSNVNTLVGFTLLILRTEIEASKVKITHFKSIGFDRSQGPQVNSPNA